MPPYTELPPSSPPAFINQLLPHSSAHGPLNQNTRQTSCAHVTLDKASSQTYHLTTMRVFINLNTRRFSNSATFCL